MVYEITDKNFIDEVASSSMPCVVGFTASWCTVCDKMVPILEELSDDMEGVAKFCLVDTDTETKLRITFAVAALPYVVYIHEGMQTPLFDELVPKERLKERIQFMLNDGKGAPTRPLGSLRALTRSS